jgi:hypothetical protein
MASRSTDEEGFLLKRSGIVTLALVACLVIAAAAQSVRIPDPDLADYPLYELALLIPQIVTLSDVVEQSDLGSRHVASDDDWGSRQFALYVRGVLESLGYRASVGVSPTDPSRAWVVVELSLMSGTARVPVEATPPPGEPQTSLGSIPWQGGESGFRFDPAYTTYVPLPTPDNQPPQIWLYAPKSPLQEGQELTFRSTGSLDPDGEIVLYVWDYDDGKRAVTTVGTSVHVYGSGGFFTVRLTVIDDLGAPTVASARIYLLRKDQHCAACDI